jgi:hypothetical protein
MGPGDCIRYETVAVSSTQVLDGPRLQIVGRLHFGEEANGAKRRSEEGSCSTRKVEAMTNRSYVLIRNPRSNAARVSWTSPNGALYCGICLRSTVKAEVGDTCPACSSHVQQVFEVADGGKASQFRFKKKIFPQRASTAQPLAKVVSL